MKNYWSKNKKSLLWCIIALVVIFVTSMTQMLIQSAGGSIEVSDLRNATNTGVIAQRATYEDEEGKLVETTVDTTVKGEVVSGILFKPKKATAENKVPGIVLTHGYLNNREMQLPFTIELARRGYVVLTIDRQGHGNYEMSDTDFTKGLYESTKYMYNLDYVDKTKIGISGHSMGGATTASVLSKDNYTVPVGTAKKDGKTMTTYGLGIVKAGLIQAWSTFMGASPTTSVGMLKANDDEFFYSSTDSDGNKTLPRQFLNSVTAANFVGIPVVKGQKIDIQNKAAYVNGEIKEVELGTSLADQYGAFRAIYEADEIHPLNHWSIPSTANLVQFFYDAFGTPNGSKVIGLGNQVWWVKEGFSFLGMLALLSLIFPVVSLMLTIPFFASLTKRRKVTEEADGRLLVSYTEVTPELIEGEKKPIKKWYQWVMYFAPAVIVTLVAGFSIHKFCTGLGDRIFPNTPYFPQDTTNVVAIWTLFCGVFAALIVLLAYGVNTLINKIKAAKGFEADPVDNPFETARISSGKNAVKTFVLAFLIVFILYLIVFINWAMFVVDFRLWTLDIKVFNVPEMLPTAFRYFIFFGIYYILAGIANQTYRAKNLPEWATIAINAFFNVFGISLVIIIQYGVFKSTGVLWQPDMSLSYIVLFPIVPILIMATVISRILYKKTGNIWLGSLINGMLFTMMTVANTASSNFPYIL